MNRWLDRKKKGIHKHHGNITTRDTRWIFLLKRKFSFTIRLHTTKISYHLVTRPDPPTILFFLFVIFIIFILLHALSSIDLKRRRLIHTNIIRTHQEQRKLMLPRRRNNKL
jgi:hypothetical protein